MFPRLPDPAGGGSAGSDEQAGVATGGSAGACGERDTAIAAKGCGGAVAIALPAGQAAVAAVQGKRRREPAAWQRPGDPSKRAKPAGLRAFREHAGGGASGSGGWFADGRCGAATARAAKPTCAQMRMARWKCVTAASAWSVRKGDIFNELCYSLFRFLDLPRA
jgi:hypothetical protein